MNSNRNARITTIFEFVDKLDFTYFVYYFTLAITNFSALKELSLGTTRLEVKIGKSTSTWEWPDLSFCFTFHYSGLVSDFGGVKRKIAEFVNDGVIEGNTGNNISEPSFADQTVCGKP